MLGLFYHSGKCSALPLESESGIFLKALGGQASATLNAAASKNFAAISSSIAFAEAVLDFALALMWLISTFWHKFYPDFIIIVLFDNLCLL